ncbi:Aristolochene synthase [Colletotrichum spinosum]|uniref:Aristolochene synthase n=1 Tax=Colletotrichum spinosum TaxID=1347390 RepID=A0A4R8PZT6_9PEZI|nr:Aristolochene synthase [Colletotrichum spinosum]
MSFEEGSSYNEKPVSIITGDAKPGDGSPIENIVGDVWHEMEILDIRLAHDLMEPMFDFWFLFSRHISVVNDLASWDKECRAEREIDAQGSVVSNIVQILSDDCGFSPESAKAVLWAI